MKDEKDKFKIYPSLPHEPKPVLTIQDSYLQSYVEAWLDRDSNIKNELENKIFMDFKNSNKFKESFSGRKTKRNKNEIDPLDIGSIRKNKMNIIDGQKNKFEANKSTLENELNHYHNSDQYNDNNVNEKINDETKPIINNENIIIKSAELYSNIGKDNKLNLESNEVELIPISLRNKMKK